MPNREIETGLAQESRELAAMLYTRNQYLKDHLATLMGLICHYDAALHDLAGLSGSRGGRVLRNLESALGDLNRDGLLQDMMEMLERSAVEAADLEEIASTQHALSGTGAATVTARTWAREVSGQIRSVSRGRIQARWQVEDTPESRLILPPVLPDLVASTLRTLAERAAGSNRLEGRIESDGPTARVIARLGPVGPAATDGPWQAAKCEHLPPSLRMACCLFRTRGGWLEVQSPEGEGKHAGGTLRVIAQMPLATPVSA